MDPQDGVPDARLESIDAAQEEVSDHVAIVPNVANTVNAPEGNLAPQYRT